MSSALVAAERARAAINDPLANSFLLLSLSLIFAVDVCTPTLTSLVCCCNSCKDRTRSVVSGWRVRATHHTVQWQAWAQPFAPKVNEQAQSQTQIKRFAKTLAFQGGVVGRSKRGTVSLRHTFTTTTIITTH